MHLVALTFLIGFAITVEGVQYDFDSGDDLVVEPFLRNVDRSNRLAKRHLEEDDEDGTSAACASVIKINWQPSKGHISNGSRVEIYQQPHSTFTSNYIECRSHDRPSCHGIHTLKFKSECVTLYQLFDVFVRLDGTNYAFQRAQLKVPIACQCLVEQRSLDPRLIQGKFIDFP
uniref:NGF domain-containing protein n=1 Tax=Rhabditophanes sp. KR3021 TaxID=114890 RepID=A0AC35UGG1_9BILA